MKKINTDSWREYVLGDFFTIDLGGDIKKNDIETQGKYPIISAQAVNNGICGYIDKEIINHLYENKLTIGMRGSYRCYYHQYKFIAGNNVAIFSEKIPLTTNQKIFISMIINKLNYNGYDTYPTKSKLPEEILTLPTKNNQPDWEYMETYITQKQEEAKEKLQQLQSISEKRHEIDISSWEEYELKDILPQIKRGTRIKKNNRTEGNIPLITAGNINQGIAGYIEKNEELFTKNSITVDMFGNAFFRDYNFFADDNIIIFKNDVLNTKQLLFINIALQYLTQIFDYRNQFRIASIDNLKIKLPTKNNQPDWEYMENYITCKQAEVQEKLRGLRDE